MNVKEAHTRNTRYLSCVASGPSAAEIFSSRNGPLKCSRSRTPSPNMPAIRLADTAAAIDVAAIRIRDLPELTKDRASIVPVAALNRDRHRRGVRCPLLISAPNIHGAGLQRR